MVLAAKARALLEGNPHVAAEDLRWAATAALRHRIVLGYEATADGVLADTILESVLTSTAEPRAGIRGAP